MDTNSVAYRWFLFYLKVVKQVHLHPTLARLMIQMDQLHRQVHQEQNLVCKLVPIHIWKETDFGNGLNLEGANEKYQPSFGIVSSHNPTNSINQYKQGDIVNEGIPNASNGYFRAVKDRALIAANSQDWNNYKSLDWYTQVRFTQGKSSGFCLLSGSMFEIKSGFSAFEHWATSVSLFTTSALDNNKLVVRNSAINGAKSKFQTTNFHGINCQQ